MSDRHLFTSLTRISDLRTRPFETAAVDREAWRNGDYIVAEVLNTSSIAIELDCGRMTETYPGDLLVAALGRRHATLEAVGTWEEVGADGRMELLTGAGLAGKLTSISAMLPTLVQLAYRGHVHVEGQPRRMSDYAWTQTGTPLTCPVVLVVGTSMSAGKTATCRVVTRLLRARGVRVVGAKLTGAGRYRDILTMRDAGAEEAFDFVDAGLPSTICDPEEYRPRLRALLDRIARARPDVLVAEAGASPLEPYNGGVVLEELGNRAGCLLLAAADPYAVVGIRHAFGMQPDLVTGLATSTEAGCQLIEKLSGIPAVNVLDPDARAGLEAILLEGVVCSIQPRPQGEPA